MQHAAGPVDGGVDAPPHCYESRYTYLLTYLQDLLTYLYSLS